MAKLTDKQKRFVEEYLIDLNATQAAIRAGYKVDNARQTATENLAKPYILEEIEKALAERSRRTGVTADRVLLELAKIAFVNVADVIDTDTATVAENASRDDTAAIQVLKIRKLGKDGMESEIRMADKLKALELLGKHLGMFKDRLVLSGTLEEEKSKLDELVKQISSDSG